MVIFVHVSTIMVRVFPAILNIFFYGPFLVSKFETIAMALAILTSLGNLENIWLGFKTK